MSFFPPLSGLECIILFLLNASSHIPCVFSSCFSPAWRWRNGTARYRESIPVILVANKIDVDYKVTQKKFAFGTKKGIPFEFVSAADGTNVVRVFKDAIRAGFEYKQGDKKDFMDDVMELLGDAVEGEDEDGL